VKIAVIGSGAIGCLVAGYLKLQGEPVCMVGKASSVAAIKEHGLKISGVRGDMRVPLEIHHMLVSSPELAILAVKTQDIEEALRHNLEFLKNSTLLTTQNGIQADSLAAKYIPKENIISSIVMFGATYLEPGKVVHNFEGNWVIGRMFGENPDEKEIDESLVLNKAFPTVITQDIKAMKYLKIFVNANNCIPALLGISMQEAFSDLEISRISIAIWKEGFEVICRSGLKLASLPGFPLENVTKLICLPSLEAAKIFSGLMAKLSSDPLYGSILQSIKRGRPSEIDYINGEFVNLAKESTFDAPLNAKLVELVHEVEKTRKFLSKEELIYRTKAFLDQA
jgi:2-dehydropantoate 2-reductase